MDAKITAQVPTTLHSKNEQSVMGKKLESEDLSHPDVPSAIGVEPQFSERILDVVDQSYGETCIS